MMALKIRDISRCPTCGDWWCNWCDDHYADCACPGTHEPNDIECAHSSGDTPEDDTPEDDTLGYSAMLVGVQAGTSVIKDQVLKQVLNVVELQLEDLEGQLVRCEVCFCAEQYGAKCAVYGILERKDRGTYRVMSVDSTYRSYCYFETPDVTSLGINRGNSPHIQGAAVIYLGGRPTHPWRHIIEEKVESHDIAEELEADRCGLLIFEGKDPVVICVPDTGGEE